MMVMITMPQLGLTMTEGTVVAWLKKPGELVKKDDLVLTISTDKVDMDVESPADGTLDKILIEIGETVPVGTTLAHLATTGDDAGGFEEREVHPRNPGVAVKSDAEVNSDLVKDGLVHRADVTPSEVRQERIVASPRAKKLAIDLKVDLAKIKGTGPQNRILAEDVERAASQTASAEHTASQTVSKDVNKPDARRRQIIADRMIESITTIPAFSVSVEVNAEQLVLLHQNIRESIGQATNAKLTYTDLLLKALAIALSKTHEMNTLWDGGALHRLSDISVGLAVATDQGVLAPTLTAVSHLSLEQIVKRRADLTDRARHGKLTFADMEGASGTLSNLGMYRVDQFQGLITPGQTFILAVGRLSKRPWADDELTIKPTIKLNLSVDHRVADGAVAAVFLERIAEVLENPYQILLNGHRSI